MRRRRVEAAAARGYARRVQSGRVRDEDQQLAALDWERVGTVDLTPSEQTDLGARIRAELA